MTVGSKRKKSKMADFEVALATEASGDNFCVSLWDINSGMQLKAYKGGGCSCRCVCLLGNDYVLASQANKPVIHVWNMAKETVLTKLICPGKVTAMTSSPDGVYCVVACGEKIYIWQVASGNLLALLSRHFQRVSCLKFTDDGSHFLSCGDDNLVMVWKMARVLSFSSSSLGTFESSPSPRYTWSEHALPVTDIHCGHGGMRAHVITSSLDQTCKLYDLSSGDLLCSIVFDTGVTAVVMDAAEQSFFAGCADGSIYQVELLRRGMKNNIHMEKEEALIFNGHSKQINSLAVSMDSTLLLSGSDDQSARVWHVQSRQCLRVVNHKGAVTNSQIIPKPLYLDNPPSKSSLPPIQPFKRHVHVPNQSREKHVSSHSGTAEGESNSDCIRLVLKGKLSEESSFEHMEKRCEVMARPILSEVAKLEVQGAARGGKRQLSRRELEEELEHVKRVNRNFYKFAVEELMKEVHQATGKVFFIEMGIACSCDNPARYKDAMLSRAEPCLASIKTKTRWRKVREQNEQNSHCTKPRQDDFRGAVKNRADIDPIEEDEPAIPKIKEIKVLPPIRKRSHAAPQISYKPNRIWGGSVSSYLDTIQRDAIIDEDLITGRKKRECKTSSMTLHTLQRCNESGELISCGEKQVTRVPSEPDKPQTIKQLALRKRQLSSKRNSGLIPVSS